MLVLSRKPGEDIVLNVPPSDEPRQIIVKTVRIGPNTVRLGVEAPGEIAIARRELFLRPIEEVA